MKHSQVLIVTQGLSSDQRVIETGLSWAGSLGLKPVVSFAKDVEGLISVFEKERENHINLVVVANETNKKIYKWMLSGGVRCPLLFVGQLPVVKPSNILWAHGLYQGLSREWVAMMGQVFNSSVQVFHVSPLEAESTYGQFFDGVSFGYLDEIYRSDDSNQKVIAAMEDVEYLRQTGMDVGTCVISSESNKKIADAIYQETHEGSYDLLVIGCRKYSFFDGWWSKSITENILKKSEMHLLVMPYDGFSHVPVELNERSLERKNHRYALNKVSA
ncbi:MAG: universal stress protein [Deltaproteobacteria bacterium]|nr:MAG: universal stress protein [Deltaproteobacteria bacterium]